MSWETHKIEELASSEKAALATGPFGSAVSSKHFRQDGVPMLRGSNLSENVGTKLNESDLIFLETELAETFSRSTAKRGDLIFTCWGTVGQIGLLGPDSRYEKYIVSNKQMKLTVDRSKVDPLFLYYNLSQPKMIFEVQSRAIGSTIPGFNLGQLKSLTVNIPTLDEQRAIAEVLGALDDKIAANTKLAATADDYVRSMFVGLTSDASETIAIGELTSNRKDLIDPSTLGPEVRYVGLEHIPRRSMWLDSFGLADSVTSTKAGFHPGDILFGKLRPYFHKVAITPFAGVCSTDILVLTPSSQDLSGFSLASVSSDYVVERVTAASEGTRMPRTSWKDLSAVHVPWPGEESAREFSVQVTALQRSVESLIQENTSLAATRDALLAQLMSGKLRVKDVEALAAEHV
ncbi:restriction endonuclease subunit S [Arthrobacter sp. STN4]|uniref:restriction endonuclease subunit S n=1 Tax=Arthrobacter sp. STN4 TaxID=2923276 RepID=UPI002119D472|nr:restriction endonuclease subunit S [Arthrobacter sp. STN4]MCQ9162780.1 restriction endonuclease subunit S [Arthrobacter sp. STN4]